jgi:hypothetical protein
MMHLRSWSIPVCLAAQCLRVKQPAACPSNTGQFKEDVKVRNDGVLIQLLCFWTLSIVLFLFKTQRFGDWILSPSSGKNLLS